MMMNILNHMIKQYRQGCMYKSYKYKHKIKMGIWSNQYHSYLEIKNKIIIITIYISQHSTIMAMKEIVKITTVYLPRRSSCSRSSEFRLISGNQEVVQRLCGLPNELRGSLCQAQAIVHGSADGQLAIVIKEDQVLGGRGIQNTIQLQ